MEAVTGWLAPLFGEGLVLKADLDGIPALSVEREAQWRRISAAEFLTSAEKRLMLGLPKLAEDE